MATYNPATNKRQLQGFRPPQIVTPPQTGGLSRDQLLGNSPEFSEQAQVNINKAAGNVADYTASGSSSRRGLYDTKPTLPGQLPSTGSKLQSTGTKDNSAVIDANGAVTNTLPQGESAGLPAPTVATPNQPVILRQTNKKNEGISIPDATDIVNMDIGGLQDYIDMAQIKQGNGQKLSQDEQFKLAKAYRRVQELSKPQQAEGLGNLVETRKADLETRTKDLATQDAEALAKFSANQQAQLEAGLAEIDAAEQEDKNILGYVLGAQGAGTSSYGAQALQKLTANSLAKKQLLREKVQANIDLEGSRLRKDSQETIDKLQQHVDNLEVKAADYDIANMKELNTYNAEQGKTLNDKLDSIQKLAQMQSAGSRPLTAQETEKAGMIANYIIDANGNLNQTLVDTYRMTDPALVNKALELGVAIQKDRLKKNDFGFQNLGGGVIAVTDPKTGNVTFEKSGIGSTSKRKVQKVNGKDVRVDDQGNIKDINSSTTSQGTLNTEAIADYSITARGTDNLQCGELVNDYAKMNGQSLGAGDDFSTKKTAIQNVGEVTNPEVGGVVAFPTNVVTKDSKGNTIRPGHIAIVTSINGDGTINVLEANREGSVTGSKPTTGSYKITPDMIFSKTLSNTDPYKDPNATTIDLIKASRGGGNKPTEAERGALGNIGDALGQLDSLSDKVTDYQKGFFGDKLAPIAKIINENNPRDSKAVALKAQMQGIIPSIARGIFGEKGVLTDADVANYMKTLPKIGNTADANKLVQLVFMGTLKGKLDSSLKAQSRNGIDVSNREGGYVELKNKVDALTNELQGGETTTTQATTENDPTDDYLTSLNLNG